MRNEGAREKLKKRVVSMTAEKVKEMLEWMRSRPTGHARRRRTPLQEFKRNLASMTNQEVREMVAGTRQERPKNPASLIHLAALALRAITKMVGWHHTEKQSR